jgi:glutathione-regulated potassium-efflux system ancillary protein KefC
MTQHALMMNLVIYLAAAVLMVPVASHLGLGSVLGYLAAGVAIGPWGLRLITDAEAILHFSEFGVVLLLFLVGLELSPSKLWSLRKPIIGMGASQLLITTVLMTPVFHFFALSWKASLVAALGISLSSTAIALQILAEKGLFNTRAGSNGFSILLFQDLAVIPMMALIPLLGINEAVANADPAWLGALKAGAVIGGIILSGHFLLPPVMRIIAKTGLNELFTAFALLLVVSIAQLMDLVGLSMALGTFIAGLILADSEYRHALEAVIDPVKGLLMGLFFIAVGMSVDFGLLMAHPGKVAMLVLALVLVKTGVLQGLSRFSGISSRQRPFFSFLLSQGGEFAFVVFSLAASKHVISGEDAGLLILVVALSMMTTPVLMIINDKWLEPRHAKVSRPEEESFGEQDTPVVIAGFGRFGQVIARLLHANNIPVTLLDHDPEHIEHSRKLGFKVYYGDAARLDLLRIAGVAKAKILVIAIDDMDKVSSIINIATQHFPGVKVISRVKDMKHLFSCLDAGMDIDDIHRETFSSALKASGRVLHALGIDKERVIQMQRQFRQHDDDVIARMYHAHHEGADSFIRTSLTLRDELNRQFVKNRDKGQD